MREIIEDVILASCLSKIISGRWNLIPCLQETIVLHRQLAKSAENDYPTHVPQSSQSSESVTDAKQ